VAQRRMARRRGFSSPVARKRYGWTACNPEAYAQGTSLLATPICTAQDWQQGGALFQRATLVGVRGSLAIRVNAGGSTILYGNIACYDEGEDPEDPSLVATMTEEDLLFTFAINARGSDSGFPGPCNWIIPVDIRSKRKLTSDTNVLLVTNATATEFSIVPMLRACVQYG